MKVLLVVGSVNQGGAEFQLLSLARMFQSRGLDIEVLALTDYDYFLPFIIEHKIKYSFVPNDGSSLRRLVKAVKFINSKRPDVVVSYIRKVSQVALLARFFSFFRFKLIISERTSQIRPLKDLLYFSFASLANNITVNSITKFNYIRNSFPFIKNRTVYVPNLLDVDRFRKINRTVHHEHCTRITYAGRIAPEKNLINLIRAVSIVAEKGFEVRLWLYGEAHNKKYLAQVANLINNLNVNGIIEYRNSVADITEVYAQTDLLCLVSFYEGSSNVIAEGMAAGIPVLASDIPENRYLIEDGKNGFLVDPEAPEIIAEGIFKFLSLTCSEAKHISDNNRIKAVSDFNEDRIYNLWSDLINRYL